MRIYNTVTRSKEEFTPLEPNRVRIYTCGPTVYNYFHIGNARTFMFFDVVRRYFEFLGYDVQYVQNITDIDDHLIDQANKESLPMKEIARKYTEAFLQDTARLGIGKPTSQPRATEYLDRIIALIAQLVENGFAYESNGDVYFSVERFPQYGMLSGKKLDELQAGARVAENDQKRHLADFTLWKAAKPGEPHWASPWGEGRPGWHSECVVMSQDLLGKTFDIHGGAIDLVFPHHENENAQAMALSGQPLARFWMHGGFLNFDGEKMAKSVGNFLTAREVADKVDPEAIRFFFLSKHYRSPAEYSPELLAEAKKGVDHFYEAFEMIDYASFLSGPCEVDVDTKRDWAAEFRSAMDDDFNTAVALSIMIELARKVKTLDLPLGLRRYYVRTLHQLGAALGFFQHLDDRLRKSDALTDPLINLFMKYRTQAKSDKNWALADAIRNDLLALGIELLDSRDGTIWKRKG
jgi:cysteinyl-tRNA synthetase